MNVFAVGVGLCLLAIFILLAGILGTQAREKKRVDAVVNVLARICQEHEGIREALTTGKVVILPRRGGEA